MVLRGWNRWPLRRATRYLVLAVVAIVFGAAVPVTDGMVAVLQSLWQQRASPMRHVVANEIHLHLGCSHVDF